MRHWTLEEPRWSLRLRAYFDGERRGLGGEYDPMTDDGWPLPEAVAEEHRAAYLEGWRSGYGQYLDERDTVSEYYGVAGLERWERGEDPAR